MPSKRKASSSARSGKWLSLDWRTTSTTNSNEQPRIRAETVFGTSESAVRDDSSRYSKLATLTDSSEEDDELMELAALHTANPPNLTRPARRQRDMDLANILNRAAEDASKRDQAAQKLSAILVSRSREPSDAGVSRDQCGSGHVRYLPLCPVSSSNGNGRKGVTNRDLLTILPSHRDRILTSQNVKGNGRARWPMYELPVEIFDLITIYLARDDVKSMRLVNREFEQKVSRSLFHTSVVPFNTELYDMIDEDKKAANRAPRITSKGKGKMMATSQDNADPSPSTGVIGLQWKNAKEDKEGKVYKGHGLRVFQGFGPHIKRFGMSFEIAEKQLSLPPIKKELDHVESYHGTYTWPAKHYTRFANLAGLENTADETSRMKAAFSNLDIVQELALSIDNGLGWLSGPDKSLRARVFDRPSALFGTAYNVPDHATEAASEFWNAIQQSQRGFAPHSSLKETTLEYRLLQPKSADLPGLSGTSYSDTQSWSAIDREKLVPAGLFPGLSDLGVLYTTSGHADGLEHASTRLQLTPAELRKEQKEWLLETQWAQQAFMESYMLAVVDNPTNFWKVTTLNIAKLSSRFLPMLGREVFWDALPCLSNVVLHISPDWRTVEKDDAGFAETKHQSPSEAVRIFHKDILRGCISLRESVKQLNIGWIGGGEHAEGMFARNNNILPAPVTQLDHATANSSVLGIVFKHVEHLTLYNCWITPPTLEGLVKSHSSKALRRLTLDSVSLTAHPRFPANGHVGGGQQQLGQAMAAMQAHFAHNAAMAPQQQQQNHLPWGPQAHQGAQGGHGFVQNLNALMGPGFLQGMHPQQVALMQQQWQQQMQQVQQMFNAANGGLNPLPGAANNVVPLPPPPMPPALNTANPNLAVLPTSHWTAGHREGSWPWLLDAISPGPVFDDYLPAPAPWEQPLPPRPETNLQIIDLKSCGYARLSNHGGFDQLVLEPELTRARSMTAWFRVRYASLKPAMMESRDRHLGQIVQYMPERELDALLFAWGLRSGWSDWFKAEEAEYDGFLTGGTGRISGVIEKGMALVGQPAGTVS